MTMKFLLAAICLTGMLACGLGCAGKPKSQQNSCVAGEEGCSCDDGACDQGLRCTDGTCEKETASSGGSSGGDSSATAGASGGQGGAPSSTYSSSTKPAPPPASPNCTDVSITPNNLAAKGGVAVVDVVGKTKNYFLQSNWWNVYNKQVVTGDGLSFTVSNPAGAGTSNNDPAGYPSIYIGASYSGRTPTKGCNLPKQVSALKGSTINTILSTNANSKGRSNYNVAYDVWFTTSATAMGSKQYDPGPGGAYLMVWFFKPTDRQPRGQNRYPGRTISGVPGTWDVWVDNTNPLCISYVHTTGVETLDFDLNKFIQDSVDKGYGITSSMYLHLIFGGFEIWGGGDGLQVKAFCADVP